MECRATAAATHLVDSRNQLGQAAASVAGAQSQLTGCHLRIAHSFTVSMLHKSCVLKLFTAAVNNKIRPPNAQSETPGTTVARWASLTSATSTPRINTCVILHGLTDCRIRRIDAISPGSRPNFNGKSTYSMREISTAGIRIVVTNTREATPSILLSQMASTAPYRLAAFNVPWTSKPTIGNALATMKRIAAPSV